jgi:hypothetical protein
MSLGDSRQADQTSSYLRCGTSRRSQTPATCALAADGGEGTRGGQGSSAVVHLYDVEPLLARPVRVQTPRP